MDYGLGSDRQAQGRHSSMFGVMTRIRASRWGKAWSARRSAPRYRFDAAALRVLAGFRPVLIENWAGYQEYKNQIAVRPTRAGKQQGFQGRPDREGSIRTRGLCYPCHAWQSFATPAGPRHQGGSVSPNWREGLVCAECGMNSRMRASVHLLEQCLEPNRGSSIYLTEQVTPLYRWMAARYDGATGSEFLRDGTDRGRTNSSGIRHEDMTALSFRDETLEHIITLEVLEHVPDFRQALRECARVLKPGGSLVLSAPFHRGERHLVRARVREDRRIEHLEPPEYHGDPLSPEGCLCFYHFGWELLDDMRAAGFRKAAACIFESQELCYTDGGGAAIQFLAWK
jgi:hypothetical protein